MYNCFYEEKPLGKIIMHVLVDQEHDGPPRTKSHDLRHYALVERQEPATVNHGDLCSQVNRHLPFLPVHPCDHPSSSPVNLFPLRLGALSTNTLFTSSRNPLHISQQRRPHSYKKPYRWLLLRDFVPVHLNPRLGHVKGNIDTAAKGSSGQTNSNLKSLSPIVAFNV